MKTKHLSAALAALTLLGLGSAHAGPADYVNTPSVEYGEKELGLHLGSTREKGAARENAALLTIGMGLTQRWFSEVGAEFTREAPNSTRLEAVEWENVFLLTEPGEYPVDLGLLFEVERAMDHAEGWEVKLGPLLQTEFGKLQLNFNPILERHFDSEEHSDTELTYQWQAKYRYLECFEYGFQGFGEVGKWNDWEERSAQTHKAGPAVFGKLPLGGRHALKYDAALLFGLNRNTADQTLRATLEYEF